MSVGTPAVETYHEDPPQPASARPSGRLKHLGLTESDRNYAIAMHLSPLVLTLLGAWPLSMVPSLVLWLVRKNNSVYDDDHGREVINFMLSYVLWHIVLLITVIGIVLWPVLWIVAIVNNIRGAIAAGNGEYFRYPMTIRFLS